MPLKRWNSRTFHRRLKAGQLETVVLLKREDDQREGIVVSLVLYQCWWSMIFKSGEPLLGDMSSAHTRLLHLPRCELDRVGVAYVNAIDRFVDEQGRYWQPESTTQLVVKQFEQQMDVACLRVDPPRQ